MLFCGPVMSDSATPWTIAPQAPLSMGFFQARTLEWVAVSFSRGSSQPRDRTCVSCFGRWVLCHQGSPFVHVDLRKSEQRRLRKEQETNRKQHSGCVIQRP